MNPDPPPTGALPAAALTDSELESYRVLALEGWPWPAKNLAQAVTRLLDELRRLRALREQAEAAMASMVDDLAETKAALTHLTAERDEARRELERTTDVHVIERTRLRAEAAAAERARDGALVELSALRVAHDDQISQAAKAEQRCRSATEAAVRLESDLSRAYEDRYKLREARDAALGQVAVLREALERVHSLIHKDDWKPIPCIGDERCIVWSALTHTAPAAEAYVAKVRAAVYKECAEIVESSLEDVPSLRATPSGPLLENLAMTIRARAVREEEPKA